VEGVKDDDFAQQGKEGGEDEGGDGRGGTRLGWYLEALGPRPADAAQVPEEIERVEGERRLGSLFRSLVASSFEGLCQK
jgi:hypothetical protein